MLEVGSVGRNDNYFALGGDSIRAIHIVSELYRKGYSLTVAELMQGDTLRDVALKLKRISSDTHIISLDDGNIVPLPPIAKAYLKSKPDDPSRFYQSCLIRIKSDINTVEKAVTELSKQHELLRSVMRNGSLSVLSESEFDLLFGIDIIADVDENNTEDAKNLLKSRDVSFSFDGSLLLDVAGCKMSDGYLLRITIHHFIVDLFSWEILVSDLRKNILRNSEIETVAHAEKTVSFSKWVQKLEMYKSHMPPDEIAYWMQCNAQLDNTVQLISDSDPLSPAESVDISIESAVTEALLETEKQGKVRLDALLLSALGCAASRIAGGSVGICAESHGRTQLHEYLPIDRTVGWFTSVYPVIVKQNNVDNNLLYSVKRTLENVPKNGIGWLLKYERLPCFCGSLSR